MEQAPITVSQIREATHGDPVLSRARYYILHGWPAEKCIPDELKIYCNNQDEFTVKDGCILCGTRAVILTKYQAAVLSELHYFESSWNGPHEVPSQIICVVAQPRLQCRANSARLPCLPSKSL